MVEEIKKLSKKQMEFIEEELGITEEQLQNMTEEEFYDMSEKIADIEVHESMLADDDGELSERGEMAASIITLFGESFAEDMDTM